tara:strand:- start:33 stop:368 length:336 start_codon:yes stop_codon:yes gene_type:complete
MKLEMKLEMSNPEEEDDMPGFGVHDETEPGKPYEQQRKDWIEEVARLLAKTDRSPFRGDGDNPNHTWACHRLAYLFRTCEYPVWAAQAVGLYQWGAWRTKGERVTPPPYEK